MPSGSQGASFDAAFKALEQYSRGDDPEVLAPIQHAVREAHGDPAARAALEARLAAALRSPLSESARAFVCRELAVIGSAASVPALAVLLTDEDLSHMARYALERIPGPEADKALRDAISRTTGTTRIGIMQSVGVRRDARSVPLLTPFLSGDPASAAAAARALGEIGTAEATRAVQAAGGTMTGELGLARADALLIGAERLMAAGEREQAVKVLESLADPAQAPHVRMAASRALSAAQRP